MVGWLKSIEYLGIRCCTNSLHRSLSHISASLSHKNGEFFFSFKFGLLDLLHQWLLQTVYTRVDNDSQRVSVAVDSHKIYLSQFCSPLMISSRCAYKLLLILMYQNQQGGRRHTSECITSTRDEHNTSS